MRHGCRACAGGKGVQGASAAPPKFPIPHHVCTGALKRCRGSRLGSMGTTTSIWAWPTASTPSRRAPTWWTVLSWVSGLGPATPPPRTSSASSGTPNTTCARFLRSLRASSTNSERRSSANPFSPASTLFSSPPPPPPPWPCVTFAASFMVVNTLQTELSWERLNAKHCLAPAWEGHQGPEAASVSRGTTVPLSCTNSFPWNPPENPNQCLHSEERISTLTHPSR